MSSPVQLTLKQMELAKVRISKILRNNYQDSYISDLTTYPAIAAINSKSTDSYALVGAGQIDTVLQGHSATPNSSNCLYVAGTTPTGNIGDLLNILINDPGWFDVITSKAYMLAITNSGTSVTPYDSTSLTGMPASLRETSSSITQYTTSLQFYINYLAANTTMCGGSASDADLTTALSSTSGYTSAKCIIGEGNTSGCTLTAWSSAKASQFLTLKVLCKNIGTTSGTGYLTGAHAFNGTSTDFSTYITGLVTNGTGGWDLFEASFPNIASALITDYTSETGRDAFLTLYNNLEHTRAITELDYAAFHETISTINGLAHVKDILTGVNKTLINTLVNEGIMTYSQVNLDYTDQNDAVYSLGFLTAPYTANWVTHLPLGTGSHTTAWHDYAGSAWFYAAANDLTFSRYIASDRLSFKDLIAIGKTSSSNGGPYGYGIYGDENAGSKTDTYENFLNLFIKNIYAKVFIKAGIPLSSFCSGGVTDSIYCQINYTGIGKNMTTSPIAANEFTSIWDCLFSEESVELYTSPSHYYWQSPYDLLQDIAVNVCI